MRGPGPASARRRDIHPVCRADVHDPTHLLVQGGKRKQVDMAIIWSGASSWTRESDQAGFEGVQLSEPGSEGDEGVVESPGWLGVMLGVVGVVAIL